ncbi:MAG: hypothetical protein HFI33_08560 [Lachnospiraceae bacterium]|jgi:hypothetical protein|nr:hypothetical protein [Lachnospiraceae bacterium]
MFELKKWRLGFYRERMVGYGECFGNPQFPDGFPVHTSRILEIMVCQEKKELRLHTHSGSCYRAAFVELDPYDIEKTREVLRSMKVDVDLAECLTLGSKRAEDERLCLEKQLLSGDLYIKMPGGFMIDEAYFKKGDGAVVPISVTRHVSTFSRDSILVTDWEQGLCDFRIFPVELCEWLDESSSMVKAYHWSNGLNTVSIENTGDDFEFQGARGNIMCRRGTVTIIKKEDFTGECLISPDVVDGKSCIFRK